MADTKPYDPARMLDAVIHLRRLKNDAALCRELEVFHPIISKIRHRHIPVSASILLRIHEVTGLEIKQLRALMGDQRKHFRFS